MPLGLIEGDVEVRHQAAGRREIARAHRDRLEREPAVRMVAEALLDSAFLIGRQVQLRPRVVAAPEHRNVRATQPWR